MKLTWCAPQRGRISCVELVVRTFRGPRELGIMYIGLGTLVLVLVIVGIVFFVRRA
jgi:hypothetical protein